MSKVTVTDALELSIPERIQLVEDIWDTIAHQQDAVTLSEEEKRVIDQRLAEYHKNPAMGSPWSDVKKRILQER
jgi:putative addiction module component (TIGR02574 family)